MGLDTTGVDYVSMRNGGVLVRESIPGRTFAATDQAAALTTQVMTSVAVPVLAGDVISTITFISGATAAGTPTNWWFALYDDTGALLAQTADQTSTAWAANTKMPVALAAAQTIKRTGIAFAACMVKATTVPSLVSLSLFHLNLAGPVVAGMKTLAQTSGAALTTTAPATIATPTVVALVPYCVLS